MSDRFVQALIGIDQIDVFADHRDIDGGFRVLGGFDQPPPFGEIRLAGPDIQLFDDALIEFFLVKLKWHFVNRGDVLGRDYAVFLDVAEMRDLAFEAFFERTIAAA